MIRAMTRFLVLLVALAAVLPAHAESVGDLRFIGAVTLPNDLKLDGAPVGGLSGLDYDAKTGTWVMISDDRSDRAPARFYTAKFNYEVSGAVSFEILRATTLSQADGTPFPGTKAPQGDVPDPEAIRLDPESGNLWWTSEGDRARGLDPAVKVATSDGRTTLSLPTPPIFRVNRDREEGARHNLSFEGLSFAPDGQSLFVAMETATYQDGPLATVEAGTLARIIRMDRSGKVLAQYAYPIDPIQARPTGKNADNGLSEIVVLDARRLLAVEHCGVEGADGIWANYIRVYEMDLEGASDIAAMPSLISAPYTPVKKRLVLDLAKRPGIGRIDNIEGMALGPRLANGNRSLVLVSDNNFNPAQATQLLAFEMLP